GRRARVPRGARRRGPVHRRPSSSRRHGGVGRVQPGEARRRRGVAPAGATRSRHTLMPIWWYVARASGLVAWALLTLSVVWGVLLSTKLLGRKPMPAWILDLHRFLGGATVVFTGLHLVAILVDSYVHFDLVAILVPFASQWNPLAVAWGIAAFYLLAAVEITSLLRRSLPRLWRRVHYASFPLFALATIHGVAA